MADYLRLILLSIFLRAVASSFGEESLPDHPRQNFLPNQSPIFIGGQLTSEKLTNANDDEYFYDDGAVETVGTTQEPIETMPIKLRTTMAPIQVTESFSHPRTTTNRPETFATLLVDEVKTAGEKRKTTRPPLKLVRLNDGELIHQKRLKFQDPSSDGIILKQKKIVDWRPYWNKLFWQAVPTKRRTLVVKDIGDEPEDLPPFPPGAQLIQIIQKKIRLNRDAE